MDMAKQYQINLVFQNKRSSLLAIFLQQPSICLTIDPDSPVSAEMEHSMQTHVGNCTESSNTSSSQRHERIDDQSSNMASSSSTNPSRDYLTCVPNEILIKVLSELPIFNYLDVAHTSRHLRSVLKANAARICNLRISSRYRFAAQYLQTELRSDWLLPYHEDIYHMERTYGMRLGSRFIRDCEKHHNHDDVKHFSLLGQLFPDDFWKRDWMDLFHIKISDPGPQYLLLLESDLLDICDGGGDPNADESERESKLWSEGIQCGCAAHFMSRLDALGQFISQLDDFDHVRIWGNDAKGPKSFLDEFNNCHIPVKDGNLSAEHAHSYMPRGLIWYYGVDNLVTTWKGKP